MRRTAFAALCVQTEEVTKRSGSAPNYVVSLAISRSSLCVELTTYRFDDSFASNFCEMVALRLAFTYGHFIISNPRFLPQREMSHLRTILAISHNMGSFFSMHAYVGDCTMR